MQYPKCKHCGHSKTKHRSYPDRSGYLPLCWSCYDFWLNGPNLSWETDASQENFKVGGMYHRYLPDNLSFVEQLAARRKLI
jgi:hypothetical protein